MGKKNGHRLLLLISLVFTNQKSLAWLDDSIFAPYQKVPCMSYVKELVKRWNGSGRWKQYFSSSVPTYKRAIYMSPTALTGEWIKVEFNQDKIKAYKITPFGTLVISPDDINCSPHLSIYENPWAKETKREDFKDKDLSRYLKNHPKALIIIWSPMDRKSIESVMAIVNIAKKYHYPYKVLLTPDGDLNSAERLIKRYSVSKSYLIKHHSLELYFHAPIKQYPLIFDIQKNTLQERVIIGPKTYDEYEEIFYFNPNDIQKNDINGRSRT